MSIFSTIKNDVSGVFHRIFNVNTEAEVVKVLNEAETYLPLAMSVLEEASALLGPSPLVADLENVITKLVLHISVPGEPGVLASESQITKVLQAVAVEGLSKVLPKATPAALNQVASLATTAITSQIKAGQVVPAPKLP